MGSRFRGGGGFARPENALKRAEELENVGQKGSALQVLHEVITSKRHRTWSKTYESIMFKHIDLVVELKKRNYGKEALMQYRNMCQAVNINSLEEVIKYYLNKAGERAEEAQNKAAVGAGAVVACWEDHFAPAGHSPFAAWAMFLAWAAPQVAGLIDVLTCCSLAADRHHRRGRPGGGCLARGHYAQLCQRGQEQGAQQQRAVQQPSDAISWRSDLWAAVPVLQDRTDRELVTPWFRFLWEAYRSVLEILRTNPKLEQVYTMTAKQAFQFCLQFKRTAEFRRLCDILRQHLTNIAKCVPHASCLHT